MNRCLARRGRRGKANGTDVKRRLKGRNSETDEEIERRLSRMEYEFSKKDEYDYIVVNDALDGAESKLEEIIDKEKNR